jgi:hypothetical protein
MILPNESGSITELENFNAFLAGVFDGFKSDAGEYDFRVEYRLSGHEFAQNCFEILHGIHYKKVLFLLRKISGNVLPRNLGKLNQGRKSQSSLEMAVEFDLGDLTQILFGKRVLTRFQLEPFVV